MSLHGFEAGVVDETGGDETGLLGLVDGLVVPVGEPVTRLFTVTVIGTVACAVLAVGADTEVVVRLVV
jgi:hypothetical protein